MFFWLFILGYLLLTSQTKNALFSQGLKNEGKLSLHIRENSWKSIIWLIFISWSNKFDYFVQCIINISFTKLNCAFCCDRSQSHQKNKLSFCISMTSLPGFGRNVNLKRTYCRTHDPIIVTILLIHLGLVLIQ